MSSFAPIADALRSAVRAHFEERGEPLEGPAGTNTLETNSGFAERRGAPLVGLYLERSGALSLEGLRVIDVGCGLGALALYFAHLGASVTALDPNAERLEVGRRVAADFGLAVEFGKGDMRGLPVEDESFDLAVMNNSLCYVVDRADRLRALAEAYRILTSGGWVAIRNPNRWHPFDQFTGLPLVHLLPPDLAGRLVSRGGRRRSRVRMLSPWGARHELARVGFEEVRVEGSLGDRRPRALGFVARYQHLSGRRPYSGRGG